MLFVAPLTPSVGRNLRWNLAPSATRISLLPLKLNLSEPRKQPTVKGQPRWTFVFAEDVPSSLSPPSMVEVSEKKVVRFYEAASSESPRNPPSTFAEHKEKQLPTQTTNKGKTLYPDVYFFRLENKKPRLDKPLLVYLPGIDGSGQGLRFQTSLFESFDVCCVAVQPTFRGSWDDLLGAVEDILLSVCSDADGNRRFTVLLGESLGGAWALKAAHALPHLVDRLVLVNPTTNLPTVPLDPILPLLRDIPIGAYSASMNALAPLLINFDKTTLHAVLVYLALGRLPELLPPDALAHRLSLLFSYSAPPLAEVEMPVLLVAGEKDAVLPSPAETLRLQRGLPKSQRRVLLGSGHVCLTDAGVDLVKLFKTTRFVPELAASQIIGTSSLSKPLMDRAGSDLLHEEVTEDLVETFVPPTPERAKELKALWAGLRSVTSPVFYGLDRVPLNTGRPLLFVGNHTLMGLYDTPLLVEEVYDRFGILLRGLSIPSVFTQRVNGRPLFAESGAVPVSPRSMYRLLQRGDNVLLFPGGIREAVHLKGEKYKLVWSKQLDFVRMAAKFRAIIVPFASIGADDALEMLADGEEMMQLPGFGQFMRDAHVWLETINHPDAPSMRAPLCIPKDAARNYFSIGEPLDTLEYADRLDDRELFRELFQDVKAEVERNIDFCLRWRERDPFQYGLPRLAYESLLKRKAPAPPPPTEL